MYNLMKNLVQFLTLTAAKLCAFTINAIMLMLYWNWFVVPLVHANIMHIKTSCALFVLIEFLSAFLLKTVASSSTIKEEYHIINGMFVFDFEISKENQQFVDKIMIEFCRTCATLYVLSIGWMLS